MKSSLPPGRTRFIGRAAERDELRSLLADPGARLVTLLGPPGTGKTRLAAEVARELEGDADVFVCDLSAAASPADAALALAHALGVDLPERSGLRTATAALGRSLGSVGKKLLLLDHLEHLLPDVRPLVEACLDAGSQVTVLATSRERLDIAGERCLALPSLPEEDAVELFRDRARAAGADLHGDVTAVLRELVARLDGIPLAIELAAARARVLPPHRLLERLDERLQLLRGTHRDLPALFEAIGLSWDRLSPIEQRALARASVFAGGFSLDAAEAVLADDDTVVVDVVQALVDRSLLTARSQTDGEARFRLLENIRVFAAARLAALSLDDDARDRLARWLASETKTRLVPLRVSQPVEVLAWLQTERDNLLAAVRRPPADAVGKRAAVRAALALHQLLRERGPAELHLEVLTHARALVAAVDDDELALRVRAASTLALRDERAWTETLGELDAIRERADALGLGDLSAEADRVAGEMLFLQGTHDDAIRRFERALESYESQGAREGAAQVKALYGPALMAGTRRDDAERVLLEAVTEADALDLPRVAARAEYRLGVLVHQRGELEAASARYEAALERLGDKSNDLLLEAGVKHKLAVLHQERGEHDAAVALFEEAVGIYETVGAAWYVGAALALLGAAQADSGNLERAVRTARRAEAVLEVPGPPSTGFAAAWVGAIECRRRERASARAAFARAHAALDVEGDAFDLALLEILEGHLAVLDGTATADEVLATARERATLGVSPRYALRFLERSLPDQVARPSPASRDGGALVIATDARWFTPPDGERVDVAKKRVLRRLLAALADRRVRAPGDVVTRAELLEAGWPGERMRADSALSRLYVSVASLRRLGLEELLLTAGDGYLLDPDVAVTRDNDKVRGG